MCGVHVSINSASVEVVEVEADSGSAWVNSHSLWSSCTSGD